MGTEKTDGGHVRPNDGGSAFPIEGGDDSQLYPDPGMSLRDWFAGQALAAMSAELKRNEEYGTAMHGLASKAYVIADAMLRARESQS